MSGKSVGRHSVSFKNPVYVTGYASVVGKKEGEGPLGRCFDIIENDPYFGQDNWEKAESTMQSVVLSQALHNGNIEKNDIKYIFAGDLLGQLMATTFGTQKMDIPLFGIYGACSTMGEALSLGAMAIDGDYGDNVVALTSSHFAGAEKQFRFPLDYGNQRPYCSTWTVTGSGAVVLSKEKKNSNIVIRGITTGTVKDYGIKDSMNMGACMAPAALNVILSNFIEFNVDEKYYDKIITGDLGIVGKKILMDMLKIEGYDIADRYMDCGIEMFDASTQDSHSGGSGCGCSASVLCGYILRKLEKGEYKRILFIPTGALLSGTSFNEGQTIPSIAHGVIFESIA